MRPACNLQTPGRVLRFSIGVILCCAAIAMMFLWAPGHGWPRWVVSLLVLAAGAFHLYAGWVGWCMCRAMGFKTPI